MPNGKNEPHFMPRELFVGVCPHCRSRRIRTRKSRHFRNLWRCNACNGIFETPQRVALPAGGNIRAYVNASHISRMESRVRRRVRRRKSRAGWAVAAILVTVGLAGAWGYFGGFVDRFVDDPEPVTAVAPLSTTGSPAPTSTPVPTPAPTSVLASAQKPIANVILDATPTAFVAPDLRHLEAKEYMLELINSRRMKEGVPAVDLGDNIAAQLHAESSLANCYSSHWGVDGLKPYMRYSLAGGYQSNGENGHGSDYCIKPTESYRALPDTETLIDEAMRGWMNSPGHRRNMLDPTHRKVNIGLAWDTFNFVAYQHFEGDFVEFEDPPAIAEGTLVMKGSVKNGIVIENGSHSSDSLGIQIFYDPPPYPLTAGQVTRTYCYDPGLLVAAVDEPLDWDEYYEDDEDSYTTTRNPCPDPYDVAPDAPAPSSPREADAFWKAAYDASNSSEEVEIEVPWITASEWDVTSGTFAIKVDLSDVIADHGPGVYTVALWGELDGEDVVFSEYSIFHDITPPTIYAPVGGRDFERERHFVRRVLGE